MPAVKTAIGENPYAKTGEWVVYCDLCGEETRLEKRRWKKQKERDGRVFCSRNCRREFLKREEWRWFCYVCGESLKWTGRDVVCSDECIKWAQKWREHYPVEKREYRIKIPERTLPFQGELWRQQREHAIDRDEYECKICGMGRDKHQDVFGRDLAVHHKKPRRKFNTAEEAHQLENLVTLCDRCHGLVEGSAIELEGEP